MKQLLAPLLAAIGCSSAWSQTANFYDDFESGTLNNWTVSGATTFSISSVTNVVPTGGSYSALYPSSAGFMYANPAGGFGITDSYDSWRFSVWIFDWATNNNLRCFATVRSYQNQTYGSTYNQILAIGTYNTATLGTYNGSKYSGRIVSGTPSGWFSLTDAPDKSPGWHHFEIERGVNSAGQVILKFYQDGILGRAFTNSRSVTADLWDTVTAGLGAGTSAGEAYYDAFEVVQGQAFIAEDPQSITNVTGNPASFSVYAHGAASSLAYQWFKDGASIPNATDATYGIPTCQITDTGWYSVMVSNVWGARTSAVPARLQVAGINIVTQPTNLVVNLGSNNVSFACEAAGVGTLSYQWLKDGVGISGATTAELVIPVVQPGNLATNPGYVCIVTNELGNLAATLAATLRSNAPPTITPIDAISATPGANLAIPIVADDDFSTMGVFQTFESGTVGAGTMFQSPSFSGSASSYVTPVGAATYVTNAAPAGNPRIGAKSLFVTMNFTNETTLGWDRLTSSGFNPTVYFLGPLKFDIWTDRPMGVSIGLHESNPAGSIGSNGGTSSSIENAGVLGASSIPECLYTNVPGTWTNLTYDLANSLWPANAETGFAGWAETYIRAAGLVGGNGLLESTTGKGVLENVGLVPADGLGTYRIFLDNFQSVGGDWLRFSLDAAPATATIDPYTGLIQWTASGAGTYNFTVRLTDHLGLFTAQSFSVAVALPALAITLEGNSVTLNWTGTYQLQRNTADVADPAQWQDVAGVTTAPYVTAATGTVFYRLRN